MKDKTVDQILMRQLIVVIVFLVFPLCTLANKSLGQDITHIAFTVAEHQVMQRYFSDHQNSYHEGHAKQQGRKNGKPGKKLKGLPPGLAKRHELPPGLAKREQLPPGLAKKALPADLIAELPPVRDGLERAIIAGSIVLIEVATGVVLDIIEDLYVVD